MSTETTGADVFASTLADMLRDAIEKFGIKSVRAELIEVHRHYESSILSHWEGETASDEPTTDDLVCRMIAAAADCVTFEG